MPITSDIELSQMPGPLQLKTTMYGLVQATNYQWCAPQIASEASGGPDNRRDVLLQDRVEHIQDIHPVVQVCAFLTPFGSAAAGVHSLRQGRR
jgi:hypothetical protein